MSVLNARSNIVSSNFSA